MRHNEYDELLSKIKCSDEFRSRMQEKLSSASVETKDYEESVSGTEVITTKHQWSKFAAMAAAVVLVCGVVGGGVYHLARINNKIEGSTNINTDENASIYSKLEINKESFNMYEYVWNMGTGPSKLIGKFSKHKERFFKYFDKLNTDNQIDKEDFIVGSRSVRFTFVDKKEKNKEKFTYCVDIYDNGSALWMMKTSDGEEIMTYHCFVDGIFDDMLNMVLEKADDDTVTQMNEVTANALEFEISNGFKNSAYDKAYYYPAGETDGINYKIVNRDDFVNELIAFEWERASVISGDVNQYYLGFAATEDGYMQFSSGMTYKLKNDSDLDAYNAVLKKHLIKKNFGETVSESDILNAFPEGYNGERVRFRTDDGQFTEDIECILENFESFKNELASLEWVTCETSEPQIYSDFYVAGAVISRNGYIYPQSAVTHQCAYKLKNENDIEKLREICDKYISKNTNENDSIYSKLIANKENYSVDLSDDIKKTNIDKDILFEYLDKYDMSSEIEPSSFIPSDKKITVYFRKSGEEKKDYSYVGATEKYDYKLVIYDTGTFTWTINENGVERLTMHSFGDGDKVFNELLEMFAD